MGDAITSLPESAETRETKAELPSPARKLICILNGGAGSKRAIKTKEQLAELFSGHGANACVMVAGNGPELTALARHAVQDRYHMVVAAGGDGQFAGDVTYHFSCARILFKGPGVNAWRPGGAKEYRWSSLRGVEVVLGTAVTCREMKSFRMLTRKTRSHPV